MKNKILTILFALCLALCSLCGCSAESSENNEQNEEIPKVSYTVTEMTVTRDDLTIYGKLYTPQKEGEMPAVILSHSAMLTSDSMQSYAVEFAERGFIAYAFDFCGGSSSSKSTSADMTIFTEVADLKASIDAVSELDNVDSSQIYLFGTSQGGLVTALTANDYCDKVTKVILLYPAFNIPDSVQNLSYNSYYEMFGYGEQFIETLQNYDPYEHISAFMNPVLIIHGTSDITVNISYSERAQTVYADCVLKTIEGAGHGFNSENTLGFGKDYDDIVWEYIDEFLK